MGSLDIYKDLALHSHKEMLIVTTQRRISSVIYSAFTQTNSVVSRDNPNACD